MEPFVLSCRFGLPEVVGEAVMTYLNSADLRGVWEWKGQRKRKWDAIIIEIPINEMLFANFGEQLNLKKPESSDNPRYLITKLRGINLGN